MKTWIWDYYQGDFVIVETIEEGNKVKAEIVQILAKDNIRYLKNESAWPKEFEVTESSESTAKSDNDMFPSSGEDESDGEDEPEPKNSN